MLAAMFSVLSMDSSSKTLQAQNITFFFSAGDLSENPDRFGNTHSVGPAEAIDPRPFGNEALLDVSSTKMTNGFSIRLLATPCLFHIRLVGLRMPLS